MATVKELVTRFGFEIDDKGLKTLEEGISAAKDGLLGISSIAGGAALSLFGFVKHAANSGDELYKMSQRLGVGVEELQKLVFVGGLADVSVGELGQSLAFLNRNIENAKNGSPELRRAFRELGISGDALRSGTINAKNALDVIGKRFESLPDGPKKVALAMELFGRSGARMIPMMNSLSRGLTPLQAEVFSMMATTTETAKAGEEFNDAFRVMNMAISAIGKQIGEDLIPVAKDIIEQITRWVVENKNLIKTNLRGFVNGLASSLRASLRLTDIFVKALSGLAQGLGGVETATKLLLFTLSALSSASLLIGIGKLTQTIVLLGNTAAASNMKLMAIPLLIGAAVVALLLVMEDIYSFFRGNDSFLGDLLKVFPELGKMFKSFFEPLFEPFVNIITMITEGFGGWKDIFKELGVLIVNVLLTPLRGIVGIVSGLSSVIGRAVGSEAIKKFAAGADSLANNMRLDSAMPGYSITPAQAIGPTTASRQTNNNLQVTQQFNFPPGTDPVQAGDKISSSVSDGLDDVLRSTQRSTANGGAY